MSKRILVIVPCYNEEKSIIDVIDEIERVPLKLDILVIDDGSTDSTYFYASQRCTTIKLIRNLGIGGAIQTGILYAKYLGYEYCLQIDGDGQHNPKFIPKMLANAASKGSSIVIGSRYLSKGGYQSTRLRLIGSKLIAVSLKLVHGIRISDPTSGMRLLDENAINLFAENYPVDYPEPISLAYASAHGLAISEEDVTMECRRFGQSSIRRLSTLNYMVKVLGAIIIARFQV